LTSIACECLFFVAAAVTGGAVNKKQHIPRAFVAAFSNGEDRKSKKAKRNLEYQEKIQTLESAHNQRQNSWQKFASGGGGSSSSTSSKAKATSSLKVAPPLKKTSMFSTPDDPNAKVGVVGSGKGMTQFQQRGKHVYERVD
jgi:survival-of-motor-neuron-related-splicing factor 30